MGSKKVFKHIYEGVINYIFDNNTFESCEYIADTIKSIQQMNNLEDIFRKPIENRLFNFEQSLHWLYFICSVIKYIKDELIELPNGFDISFNTEVAILYLSNVFSHKQDQLEEYFDSSSESDDDFE